MIYVHCTPDRGKKRKSLRKQEKNRKSQKIRNRLYLYILPFRFPASLFPQSDKNEKSVEKAREK